MERYCDQVAHIVFLGDYFDPHVNEGLSVSAALDNWHEMMTFIADLGLWDRTTLLIGNHYAHYMSPVFARYGSSSRRSLEYAAAIRSLLTACPVLQVAFEGRVGDKKILFTHAGVNEDWYSRHKERIGALGADRLNRLTETAEDWRTLAEVGQSRKGMSRTGSPLWSDVGEHLRFPWHTASQGGYDFQVFGHTKSDRPLLTETFAMLDCQRCFVMTDEAKLLPHTMKATDNR